jgi:hypothetical protein
MPPPSFLDHSKGKAGSFFYHLKSETGKLAAAGTLLEHDPAAGHTTSFPNHLFIQRSHVGQPAQRLHRRGALYCMAKHWIEIDHIKSVIRTSGEEVPIIYTTHFDTLHCFFQHGRIHLIGLQSMLHECSNHRLAL